MFVSKKYTNDIISSIEDKTLTTFFNNISFSSGCWEWNGTLSKGGYGVFKFKKLLLLCHRLMYQIVKRDLDPTMALDHVCKNRKCLNPNHLRQVTLRVNTLENSNSMGAINAAKEVCKNGHNFDYSNTRINKGGTRTCRKCMAASQKEWATKNRDKVLISRKKYVDKIKEEKLK